MSEKLNEISKKTLGSYVSKAARDIASKQDDITYHQSQVATTTKGRERNQTNMLKKKNRFKGIDRAVKKLSENTITKIRLFLEAQDGGANYLDDKGEVDAQQKMIKDKKVLDMDTDVNADKTVNGKDPVAVKDFKNSKMKDATKK